MRPTSSKRNVRPFTSSVLISLSVVLLQLVPFLHGHSHPMDLCSLTREEMIRGMGGGHLNLGYALTTTKGTTVTLQVPNGGLLKGLYLYATDASGRTVGTWETDAAGFQPIVSSTCNGGGITHSNAQVKATNGAAPSFKLNLPDDVSSATVKGFVVQAKTTWQELDPITVTKEANKADEKPGASSFALMQSSVYFLELLLLVLTCFALS